MSTVAIVLLVIAAVLVILFVGGLIANRRRYATGSRAYAEHIAAADQALEAARAEDRGWDRSLLEAAARRALERERPGLQVDELHLVLVDDRPGQAEDRAHLVGVGPDGEARVVLARADGDWVTERVE